MEEDLYPNDGTYFAPTEPAEQVVARKKEKAQTLEALPTLKKIVQHFEKRIAFYNSIEAMPKDVKSDPVKFMNMHNANELAMKSLISEKEWIESLIDTHAKNV